MRKEAERVNIIAIDLKSFYASVECVERRLDPLTTHLVVADPSRTEKTICLAVSPALKRFGIPGRARLYEVVEKVRQINRERLGKAGAFTRSAYDSRAYASDPSSELAYIVAPPRMRLYEEYSTRIYSIYIRHIAPEDIHVYSIDEVFLDVTHYLHSSGMTPRELAMKLIREVLAETGITATAGIGTNLYLAKVAMDIVAKRVPADRDGVRIAELDERAYREQLWTHRPLTDFWRVGRGYARKLEAAGLMTMGDIARCSLGKKSDYYNEELLYRLFGVNAELLIDHAWGWEPTTIAQIRQYRPAASSLSAGQVLQSPYPCDKTRIIVMEMTELMVLELVEKRLVTKKLTLTVSYDRQSLADGKYAGPLSTDFYGRTVPKHAHGTANLPKETNSTKKIMAAMLALFDRIIDPALLARRVSISVENVRDEADAAGETPPPEQLDMFTDYAEAERRREAEKKADAQERRLQETMIQIHRRYGKNALLKGISFEEGATTRERNGMIGGHKA